MVFMSPNLQNVRDRAPQTRIGYLPIFNVPQLPGVKVDAGANLRLVQLMQDGFVQLQP